ARLAVKAGIPVVIANSRGPESLAGLVDELGPLATAGTTDQAAQAGDIAVLVVPLTAHTAIPAPLLADKIILDTSNYYPFRDGRITELDSSEVTTSELVQSHFRNAILVKGFNNMLAHHIPHLARPQGAPDRTALPIAGNDAGAKNRVSTLMNELGFDAVDAGSLAESWRFEPEAAAYTKLYVADQSTPDEELQDAAARPVPAPDLQAALASATRVDVASRKF